MNARSRYDANRDRDEDTANTAPEPYIAGSAVSSEVGLASWYGPPYAGRKSADGTVYDQNAMTAANLTLPLGTVVRVTNLSTHRYVIVRITDRGPFVRGRIIDLSLAAAKAIGVYRVGVARVKVEAFASTGPVPAGRWCVQVGAFSREKDAVKLKEQLIRRYGNARVIEFAGPTGHWVRINPMQPDRARADEIAENIRTRDPAALPYIVRTN
jgi:rare lipoprotein A